ncbi:glycosyl hydrolase [Gemmatimonadetes bacterium T265]|nr:glycosyl hydrolase [Gemmatimonadetes bacterium T265]
MPPFRTYAAALAAAAAATSAPGAAAHAQPVLPPRTAPRPLDPRTEARVDSLLRRLTLEEKVGEMTQLTIQAVARVHGTATVAQQLDSAKLEDALVRYHVGSLLNVWDVALTPAQWQEVTSTVQRVARRKRVAVPVLYGIDAVHGHQYMRGGTIFPHNIALAATFDSAVVRQAAAITAYETRASGMAWNFSPVLDVGRQPLWPRFYETFGEDVHVVATLGRAAIEATQADPRPVVRTLLGTAVPPPARVGGQVFVAATGKHFLGYSAPLSGKDRTTAWIPERELREIFVPPFRAAIDAGVRTIMANSGDVNGVPVHASHAILTDLLRTELGFTGVTVSDWADIEKLHSVHRVAPTRNDAVRLAVMAGVDMSMVPYDLSFYDDLLALVHEGAVPESRVDEAVGRILRLKYELGLFDGDPGPNAAMLARANAPAFQAVSRRAAEEAVTLLKNDRAMLPLAKTARVLVVGPGATSLTAQYGGWSYTWQGTDTALYPKYVKTLLDAVRDRVGPSRVTYVPGASFDSTRDVAAAVAAARDVDVVIVALGEQAEAESPGNIDDLTLPAAQLQLAQAMEATGKPVVLALFEARPRIIRPAVDAARAIVTGYETGPFGGEAVAGVLFGDVNPSGRLPFTYPRYPGAVEHYDRNESANSTAGDSTTGYYPEFDFGHGLSYTTFAYGPVRLDRREATARDTVAVAVDVRNTGARAGQEVVQLYTRQLYASVAPPTRRLRGFQRIALAPGEQRTVTFRLAVQDLAFIGLQNRPVVEPGDVDVFVRGVAPQRLTVR